MSYQQRLRSRKYSNRPYCFLGDLDGINAELNEYRK